MVGRHQHLVAGTDIQHAQRMHDGCTATDRVAPMGRIQYAWHGRVLLTAKRSPAQHRKLRQGATVVIVNGGPTEMDDLADVRLDGSISEVLPAIVG